MSSLETADRAGDTNSINDQNGPAPSASGLQPDSAEPEGADAGEMSSPFPRRLLALAVVVVAVLRYAYASRRYAFSMSPDEMAAGGMARYLAGGRWLMFSGNIYRPGLSTLLAPLYAVVDDPAWQVRVALMANAVIAGITMLWLVPLISRLTGFGQRGTVLSAICIALLPASLSASGYVWAEPLVTMCFLATMLALLRYVDAPSIRRGVLAVLWPAVGYTSHGRLLPLIPLATLVVVGVAVARRERTIAAVTAAAAGVAYGVSYLYQRWLVSRVWLFTSDSNTSTGVVERLRHPLQIVDAAVGQIWYQLCASALLVGVGFVVLVRRAVQSGSGHERRDAIVVLWLTVPLILVSIVFMSDRARADHVVYGRYNDAVLWPVIAIGATWLFRHARSESRKVRWFIVGGLGALTVELGLMLRQLHHLQLSVSGVEPMIAGITPAVGQASVRVLTITAVALLCFGLVWLAAQLAPRRPVGAVSLILGLVAVAGVRGWSAGEESANGWRNAQTVTAIDELGLDLSKPLGVSLMPDEYGPGEVGFVQQAVASMFQWYLPQHQFVFDNGPRDAVGPYVFAVTNDALLTRDGGTIVWLSPSYRIALWKEPEVLPDGSRNPAYDVP